MAPGSNITSCFDNFFISFMFSPHYFLDELESFEKISLSFWVIFLSLHCVMATWRGWFHLWSGQLK